MAAIGRDHEFNASSVRMSIRHFSSRANTPVDKRHPLINQELATDGLDLFVAKYGQLANVSRAGQLSLAQGHGHGTWADQARLRRRPD